MSLGKPALLSCASALCITLFSGVMMPARAADSADKWGPSLDLSARRTGDRSLGAVQLMAPLAQTPDSMLFADLRSIGSTRDTWEGNAGLGYRTLTDHDFIAGGYVFGDRRITRYNNAFTQITVGAEAIGARWDGRFNVYLPVGPDRQLAYTGASGVALSGTDLVALDGRVYEQSLRGFDAELGHSVPRLDNVRLYGGGYRFWNGRALASGYRARMEADFTDWLRIGGGIQHATQGENDGYAEMRIRIPLDGFSAARASAARLSPLERRMTTSIMRDIDIVTKETAPAAPVAVMASDDSKSLKVYFVDNTAAAGGDGSQASPFNTLAAAEGVARAWDTIYVMHGDGYSTGQGNGIRLSYEGMRLLGHGVALTFDASRTAALPSSLPFSLSDYDGATLVAAGTRPVISNSGGDGVAVRADQIEVAGIHVDAVTDDGIDVQNVDTANIHDVKVTNIADQGIQVLHNGAAGSYGFSIRDSEIDGTGNYGVFISTSIGSVTGTVSGNTISDVVVRGIEARSGNSSSLDITASGNVVQDTNDDGISAFSSGSSTFTGLFENNIVTGVADDGIRVQSQNTSTLTLTVRGNQSTHHTGGSSMGVFVVTDDTSTTNLTLTGNTLSYNGSSGIQASLNSGSHFTLTATDNVMENNVQDGLIVATTSTQNASVTSTHNTMANNGRYGFYLDDNSGTAAINADFGGGFNAGTGRNRIFNNTSYDMRLDIDNATLKAENNWWGSAAGLDKTNDTFREGTSDVDYAPFLSVDPGP